MDFDKYGQLRPFGERAWLKNKSESIAQTCPFSPSAPDEDELAEALFPDAEWHTTTGRFLSAYVGHVREGDFRDRGSSGGMVSWVLDELMERGLIDAAAHVAPSSEGRFFRYGISRTPDEIKDGAKSRYYPIEMSEILREIKRVPGRYAVVGVPCFIKAVQLLRREDPVLRERIVYTLGLFCGHMKSARFAESFSAQIGIPLDKVETLDFRLKDASRPATTYTAEFTTLEGAKHKRDWWNLVEGDWGSGFFQYEACNFCDDVIAEVADISFGDAWVEPYSSDGRGTNVVVVRTAELDQIIRDAITQHRLELSPVDEEFIIATQAAGFRQRREGLAYRLTWRKRGLKAKKRVTPARPDSMRRRCIYRLRAMITKGSHRVFRLASELNAPSLFTTWGKLMVSMYHSFAYSEGGLGRLLKQLHLE
jgi:coenzyme F420-reducing hydrogenase beta subunit